MQNINIYSVSEINRKVRVLLEEKLPPIAVRGEISNFTRASSGHCYFSLKDKQAQIRCACFSPNALQQSVVTAKNGQEIVAYGRLSLYEPRGDYQLIVSSIEASGLGLLYQQFIELKQKLEQEGLFATAHKKPLPQYPQEIAIITSPIGAAYHDIMKTLERRYPLARAKLYPSEVQGKYAHLQIIEALQAVVQEQRADVIILARGGGSLEDLWAFNEETLARTIFNCPIPIITGIGHETDFTIADFVADQRGSTPSIAAEKATPDQDDLFKTIEKYQLSLARCITNQIRHRLQQLQWLIKPFEQVEKYLNPHWQMLDQSTKALQEEIKQLLDKKTQNLQNLIHRLHRQDPALQIKLRQERLEHLQILLRKNLEQRIQTKSQVHALLANKLETLSPKSTLARGYAIVNFDQRPIDNVNHLPIHAKVSVQLAHGHFDAQVETIYHD